MRPRTHRSPVRAAAATLLAALAAVTLLPVSPASAETGDTTVFTDPDLVNLWGIATGPDGNVWVADSFTDFVGRVTPSGTIDTFTHPDLVEPFAIASGPDGNMWFTDYAADLIGKITPSGTITTYEDPELEVDGPYALTAGPDGNVWFASYSNSRIGRITPAGDITTFEDPSGDTSGPAGIALGSDGNLWFTNQGNSTVGRITPGGTFTNYEDPGGDINSPQGMTAGVDGNLWFASYGSNRIGRITPTGVITTFEDPAGDVDSPENITAGPDGNVWFNSRGNGRLGRITRNGTITTFPAGGLATAVVTTGPDGDVWFASQSGEVVRVEVCSGGIFADVPITSIFRGDICWMGTEGITTGFPGNLYKPGSAVSRQAMSAFMYRLAGSPAFADPPTATFNDVPTTSQFFTEIEWMADEEITTGFPGGLYKPAQAVSRQAMSAFMYRLADEPPFMEPTEATFNDVSTSSQFFTEIEWMADEGITTGFPGGLYKPAQAVTRQAMSAFMHRLDENVGIVT